MIVNHVKNKLTNIVNRVKGKLTNVVNQWGILIADAERQVTEAKTRAAGLEKAVQNFKTEGFGYAVA